MFWNQKNWLENFKIFNYKKNLELKVAYFES